MRKLLLFLVLFLSSLFSQTDYKMEDEFKKIRELVKEKTRASYRMLFDENGYLVNKNGYYYHSDTDEIFSGPILVDYFYIVIQTAGSNPLELQTTWNKTGSIIRFDDNDKIYNSSVSLSDHSIRYLHHYKNVRHNEGQGILKGGKWDGPIRFYDLDGQLYEEITIKDGKLNGPYKFYYPNGQLKAEITYKDGKKDGPWKLYHDNGQLKDEGTKYVIRKSYEKRIHKSLCNEDMARRWLKNRSLKSGLTFNNVELWPIIHMSGKVDGTEKYTYIFKFDSGQGQTMRVVVDCKNGKLEIAGFLDNDPIEY